VGVAGAERGEQHGLDRGQHQQAWQVRHAEGGQHGGYEHADHGRQQRRQPALHDKPDLAGHPAVIPVGGEVVDTVGGQPGPRSWQAGRAEHRGHQRGADHPAGQQVGGGHRTPAQQREQGDPGTGHDIGYRDHQVPFAGRQRDRLLEPAHRGTAALASVRDRAVVAEFGQPAHGEHAHGGDGQPPHALLARAAGRGGKTRAQRAVWAHPAGDGQRRVHQELDEQGGRAAEPVQGGARPATGGGHQRAGPPGHERRQQREHRDQLPGQRRRGEPGGRDQPEADRDPADRGRSQVTGQRPAGDVPGQRVDEELGAGALPVRAVVEHLGLDASAGQFGHDQAERVRGLLFFQGAGGGRDRLGGVGQRVQVAAVHHQRAGALIAAAEHRGTRRFQQPGEDLAGYRAVADADHHPLASHPRRGGHGQQAGAVSLRSCQVDSPHAEGGELAAHAGIRFGCEDQRDSHSRPFSCTLSNSKIADSYMVGSGRHVLL
jgi:hypothetical protein